MALPFYSTGGGAGRERDRVREVRRRVPPLRYLQHWRGCWGGERDGQVREVKRRVPTVTFLQHWRGFFGERRDGRWGRLGGGSHRYVSTALEGCGRESGTAGVREVKRRVPPLRSTALEGVLGESGRGWGRLRGGSHRYVSTALEGVREESGTGGWGRLGGGSHRYVLRTGGGAGRVRDGGEGGKRRVPPLRFTALEGVLGGERDGVGVREEVRRRVPPLRFYSTGGGAGRERNGGEGG